MVNLIYLFFILFPLGQIIKIGIVSPIDLVVLLTSGYFLIKKPKIPFPFYNLFIFLVFSLIFSLSFFNFSQIFTGLLYLIRFISYLLFSLEIYSLVNTKKISREFILNSLLLIGVIIAIFGLYQYLFIPDTRFLKYFGWDDHYYRLLSTFLDPAFIGILLVFTYIISINRYLKTKFNKFIFLSVFLLLTIALTYSRASFIAIFGVSLYLFIKYRNKVIILLAILFVILIPFLPRPSGEGVRLERVYSVNQKFLNYQESFELISKSPVFGIGFDNICIAKSKFLKEKNTVSHACSGLDNSFLFIAATTGVVGLIAFVYLIVWLIRSSAKNEYGTILIASLFAISIHGLFTNTFFYNFVLGWMACLIAVGISIKE